jgi:hypothetical protein
MGKAKNMSINTPPQEPYGPQIPNGPESVRKPTNTIKPNHKKQVKIAETSPQ